MNISCTGVLFTVSVMSDRTRRFSFGTVERRLESWSCNREICSVPPVFTTTRMSFTMVERGMVHVEEKRELLEGHDGQE